MKSKKSTFGFMVLTVLLIVGTTTVFATSVLSTDTTGYKFNVNDNGQTYGIGSVSDEEVANQMAQPIVLPDLILAEGIDGTIGYVYQSDLDGEQPKNPEEAAEYMKQLEERYEEMRQTGEEYARIIPLYVEDGKTVIGQFGIGRLPLAEGKGRE